MQTTPAVFDATNARFTWTPTTAQADQKYSVKFTATDRASSPMSDSETVTIEVHATAELGGEAIYTRYCAECHNLDTGGNTGGSKDIGGKTVTQINTALQNVLQMQSLKSQLNDAEKTWLEAYLATL
jgi:mono/diheme cytochrome c family protein